MQLGIFAKTFQGNTPGAVLQQVKAAGFGAAHYNMACSGLPAMPDAIAPEVAQDVAEASNAHGVSIVGLSATWNMIHPDNAVRDAGFRRLEVLGAAARSIGGARFVTLCTGTRDPDDQWRGHPDNGGPEAWRDLLAAMERAIAIAERYDLVLGIEPELANVVDHAGRAKRLLDEMRSPRLQIVLDPANLFEIEPEARRRDLVDEAIGLLGDRIGMAHAKDRDAAGHFVAAGRGVIDFGHFVRALTRAGFHGPLVTHGLSASEAPDVAKFLTGVLAVEGVVVQP